MTLETTIRLVRLIAWGMVGPHYFIPVGGHNALGGLGYVNGALEITRQLEEIGVKRARLVVAAGSGGTLSGLMAGLSLIGSPLELLGIDVGKLWKGFPASIAHLASHVCAILGQAQSFKPEQVPLVEGEYVGPCYGAPSTDGIQAMRLAARQEGLLLDPVYTAKAFAGMLNLARQGKIGKDEALVFLHTGGLPALFAFPDERF